MRGPGGVPVRDIMGVSVAWVTRAQAVAAIDAAVDDAPLALAYLNAHGSNLAATDTRYRAALDRALVLNDGIGLDIAARVLHGARFPENLNGTDFTPHYLAATRHRYRLFLLGARPGVAERAGRALLASAPGHTVAGARDGYFDAAAIPDVVAAIRTSGADALLVALGNPAQEVFLDTHLAASGCRLGIAVGGLFDFVSGEMPRAPRILRANGLEWAFRLSLEPGRLWRRYVLGNPRFLARLAAARLHGARAAGTGVAP